VYLDAFLPEDGKSLNDYLPKPHPSVGGLVEPPDLRTAFGVTDGRDLDRASPRLRRQPGRTFSQPVDLPAPVSLRRTYIQRPQHPPQFVVAAGRARWQRFRYFELLSANHCPMITQPDELAKALLALV
jgi:hypothetical protein